MNKKRKFFDIVLARNSNCVETSCPICGQSNTPDIPFALFLRSGRVAICDECAEEYAPELLKARNFLHKDYVEQSAIGCQ